MVYWFSSFWRHFDWVKQVKCAVSRHFRDNVWEEWSEICHAHLYLVISPEMKKANFNIWKLSSYRCITKYQQPNVMLWSSSQMWSWLHPYSVGFIPRNCTPKVGFIPKYSWLHHPRFSRANISATLANWATRFIHVVPNIKISVYAKNQLCRCPTYCTKRDVLIRSLRRRPYRMKPTAVGFISLTTVNYHIIEAYNGRCTKI